MDFRDADAIWLRDTFPLPDSPQARKRILGICERLDAEVTLQIAPIGTAESRALERIADELVRMNEPPRSTWLERLARRLSL